MDLEVVYIMLVMVTLLSNDGIDDVILRDKNNPKLSLNSSFRTQIREDYFYELLKC